METKAVREVTNGIFHKQVWHSYGRGSFATSSHQRIRR